MNGVVDFNKSCYDDRRDSFVAEFDRFGRLYIRHRLVDRSIRLLGIFLSVRRPSLRFSSSRVFRRTAGRGVVGVSGRTAVRLDYRIIGQSERTRSRPSRRNEFPVRGSRPIVDDSYDTSDRNYAVARNGSRYARRTDSKRRRLRLRLRGTSRPIVVHQLIYEIEVRIDPRTFRFDQRVRVIEGHIVPTHHVRDGDRSAPRYSGGAVNERVTSVRHVLLDKPATFVQPNYDILIHRVAQRNAFHDDNASRYRKVDEFGRYV